MLERWLFAGSSCEGLEVARATRVLLAGDAGVTPRNEGVLSVGGTCLDAWVPGFAGSGRDAPVALAVANGQIAATAGPRSARRALTPAARR